MEGATLSAILKEIIKKEHLEGLIGKTHLLVLESLISKYKTSAEVFREVEGREYLTSHWQIIRAMDQLKRIGCTHIVGPKK